ncbi:MAG: hypothetical protein U1D30_15305 [Planctomycetota bacterium]
MSSFSNEWIADRIVNGWKPSEIATEHKAQEYVLGILAVDYCNYDHGVQENVAGTIGQFLFANRFHINRFSAPEITKTLDQNFTSGPVTLAEAKA